jgi:HK97 family phage major capsid protein
MSKVVEARNALNAKRDELAAIFAEAGPELDFGKVSSLGSNLDTTAKVAKVREMNDEIGDLKAAYDEVAELERIRENAESPSAPLMAHPGHAAPGYVPQAEIKSIGQLFVESEAFKGWKPGMRQGPVAELEDVDLKATLFQTSAGWAPAQIRGPRLVDLATRPIAVVDLFPQSTTTQSAIVYMEETTFTNAAVEVAEGAAKPEATLALTERNEPVRTIAVWIPVTNQQLSDVPQVRAYLDNRLGFMVRQRLDGQLLVGDGTAPNLSGILDRSGLQTQAKGADPTPDAVYKAMTKIRVNAFAEPNAAVFHPNDWQDIRLLRTADGIYIWGSPSEAGPEQIWGLRVAQSTALTENTGLVGDFQQAELVIREGVTLAISDSHSTYFVENKQAVRAEMRAALAVYRPAAFCSVTGI